MSFKNTVAALATSAVIATSKVNDLLSGLNPEQQEAVLWGEGPILLAAVAGAGKSRALVHRVAYLVQERNVDPRRILAVTFSKAGADEMNERLEKMLPNSGARIGTFHSVAYEILRSEFPEIKQWTVDSKDKFRYCIKDAAGFRELNWKKCDITLTSSFISFCKANMARPHSKKAMEIAKEKYYYQNGPKADPRMLNLVYERAEEIRRSRQLLTFDDMMLDATELLQTNENARQRWASKWAWILQDECQDQNYVQLIMGELLAKDHRNYLLVGDSAQSIFSFRGAIPSMMLSFEERWNSKVIQMGRNYRCGQAIINTANKVLNAMNPETRLDMEMICEKGTEGEVICQQYLNQDDEAESIAQDIKSLIEEGKNPKDVFILYRVNAMSRAPEEALISARIPYEIRGGTNFYDRKEVKDLLAYLRVADGRGSLDDVKRCINAPFRFLGKAFVEKVTEVAKRARSQAQRADKRIHWPSVVKEACDVGRIQYRQRASAEEWSEILTDIMEKIQIGGEQSRPVNILEDIVLATKYDEWLVKDEGEESTENSRVSNVRELIRASRRFPTVRELLDFIDDINEASKRNRGNKEEPNKVVLTTIFRSKGLERDHVYLIGINDKILPHARCEDVEEERRIFYVGVTRAKERLVVSCVNEIAIGNRVVCVEPSQFIYEAGLEPSMMIKDE